MNRFFSRLDSLVQKAAGAFSIVIFAAILLLGFAQVTLRYIFNNSLSWSEEMMRYLFIWMFFLAGTIGIKAESHVIMDDLVNRFPLKIRKVFFYIANVITFIYLIILVYLGLNFCVITKNSFSPAMQIPFAYLYASIPFGCALMALSLVDVILDHLREDLKNGGKGDRPPC